MKMSVVLLLSVGSLCLAFPTLAYSQVDTAWVRRYNGPANGDDGANAIAVDDSGNAYVTGGSAGSGTSSDYATIKYNPIGDTVWLRQYNGSANDTDVVSAIAIDGSGNVYVTGSSTGTSTNTDWATVKYNSEGVEQWVARYNNPTNRRDVPSAIAVDGSGNAYVTGYSLDDTGYYCVTIKYGPSGDTVWLRSARNGVYWASAIAVDCEGCICVTVASSTDYLTTKYSPDGDTLWVRRYDGAGSYDVPTAIAIDDSGNVYVTGSSVGSSRTRDYATVKYSAAGVEQWVARYDSGRDWDWPGDIAVDDSGNVYVTGESGYGAPNDFDYVTIKYNSVGDTVWLRRYNGPANGDDVASALALDGSGSVYVTGRSVGSGTSSDCATIRYSPEGVEQWLARYNGPANGDDVASALALDGSGNVYITGRSYGSGTFNDYVTIKYVQSVAVEENHKPQAASYESGPTVIRGVLMLGSADSRQNTGYRAELLDISGRRVLDLHPGANEVRMLAPGIYFVRFTPSAVSRQPSAVGKVVVTR